MAKHYSDFTVTNKKNKITYGSNQIIEISGKDGMDIVFFFFFSSHEFKLIKTNKKMQHLAV